MRHARDPYWTTARFASRCQRTNSATSGSTCGAPIRLMLGITNSGSGTELVTRSSG